MDQQVTIKIYGQVQGVSFRYATQRFAKSLGLAGWVCNEFNGSVKILAIGSEDDIKKLIDWCAHGPSWARVDNVEVEKQQIKESLKRFEIKFS
ncbi:acylphosphatase [Patescibacteria group bacterium]|nr:acylphosphatase [Patescibacteria group bacterium]